MTEIFRVARVQEPESPRLIEKAQKTYSDLLAGITHDPPCYCPSCLFDRYRRLQRGAGHPFSKEAFFLDWLSYEIKFSMLNVTTAYVGKNWEEEKRYYSLREFVRVRGYIAEIVKFLTENKNRFPKIKNINPGRIKMTLWRLQKSGIMHTLAQERLSQDPSLAAREKAAAPFWKSIKFAQRVARFITSRPGKKASCREILRHFSNRRKSDIDDILWALCGNYQMQIDKKGASQIFVFTPASVEQTKAYNQEIIQKIIAEENELFGDEEN